VSDEQEKNRDNDVPKKNIKKRLRNFIKSVLASTRRISNQVGAISLRHFRSPSSIFSSILYPIVLVLLFGAFFGRSVAPVYDLNVVDYSTSDESIDFINLLDNSTALSINVINTTVVSPERWLIENNEEIVLVIPFDWGFHVNQSTPTNLTIYHNPSSPQSKNIIEIIEETIAELNLKILKIDVKYGLIIDNYFVDDLPFIDSFIPGLIMIAISTIALFTGLSYDLEEKQSGIMYKLSLTPGYRFEWILSKQLWQILLALMASTLMILFALIFDFNASSLHPMMILFVIFGTMTFSGIAMILGRMITNPDGVMFASVLVTVPQILLSGALIPLDDFPQFLQFVAMIFPMFYLTEGMRFLMLDFTMQQFWLYFSISCALAIALFVLGTFVSRWKKE